MNGNKVVKRTSRAKPGISRRDRGWLLFVVLLAGILAVVFSPGEPVLLARASKVADARSWLRYSWVTNSLMLVCTDDDSSPSRSPWRCFLLERTTGQKTDLVALTCLLNAANPYGDIVVSPDGTRVFWYTGSRLDQKSIIFSCKLDGSQCVTIPGGGIDSSRAAWLGDSRHLVEYIVVPPLMEIFDRHSDHTATGFIHSLSDPIKPQRLKISRAFTPTSVNLFLSATGHALTTTPTPATFTDRIDISDTLVGQETQPPHPYHVALPIQAHASPLISPQGDRVLWELMQDPEMGDPDPTPPFLQWLHSHFPRMFPWRPHPKLSYWISRLDGSEMQEIGFVPLPAGLGIDNSVDYLPDHFAWSPDGKRLSFCYRKSCYIVPYN